MRDTTSDAESVWTAAVRSIPPIDRLRQALELSDFTRRLALARLRQTHPDHTDQQLAALLRADPERLSQ